MSLLNKIIYIILLVILALNYVVETYLPFPRFGMSSPSTRNMSYDIRCEPKIPKRRFLFGNSSIDYYYRPNCINI